jgi:hypothetical protein
MIHFVPFATFAGQVAPPCGRARLCIPRKGNEPLAAGHYTVNWEGHLGTGSPAASGVYFCRLRIGDRQMTLPMSLVR